MPGEFSDEQVGKEGGGCVTSGSEVTQQRSDSAPCQSNRRHRLRACSIAGQETAASKVEETPKNGDGMGSGVNTLA
jgi:hypothetical protein